MSKPIRPVELEHLDRLEDKVKLLVALVGKLRAAQDQATAEQSGLARELDAARARIAELEGQTAEIAALRDERETVRARVSGLLTQLEDLHLG